MHQPLVVAVDGDGQQLLGAVLTDDVLIQFLHQFPGRRNSAEELFVSAAAAFFLVQDRRAQIDALTADIDVVRAFHQRTHFTVVFPAEGTICVPLSLHGFLAASKIFTRWHHSSFGSSRNPLAATPDFGAKSDAAANSMNG